MSLIITPPYLNVRKITSSGTISIILSDNIIVVKKTVGGATSINLPDNPYDGFLVTIKDGKGDANTNNITISNGTIDGSASYIINMAYGSVSLVYIDLEWYSVS